MKNTSLVLAMTAVSAALFGSSVPVQAATPRIGVVMATFDDNFLTVLRTGMERYAKEQGVTLQIEDSKNEVGTQVNQIQNFIASGVDAIIVSAVDTDATVAMSNDAQEAGIPLVYVNRQPVNVEFLPDNQAFIASNEVDSGTLQTREVCRQLGGKGDVLVLMGALTDQAGIQRTRDIHDVIEKDPACKGMKIVAEQSGNWQRSQGNDLMTNWLSAGIHFDAVIANNDEMAIGAIQAMKAVGYDMNKVVVAGIDATQDALAAMKAGELDVTVFQDAAGQGRGAVDAALRLARKDAVDQKVWVPFELVTHSNYSQYTSRN